MALASERLMTKEGFDNLISSLAIIDSVTEYLPALDSLREDWSERDRYITEEAIPMEAKYTDLVEKYRTRFNEGLQVSIEDANNEVEQVEYTIDDLYRKES